MCPIWRNCTLMWSCLLEHEGVSKRLVICEENGAMFGANRQEKAFLGGGEIYSFIVDVACLKSIIFIVFLWQIFALDLTSMYLPHTLSRFTKGSIQGFAKMCSPCLWSILFIVLVAQCEHIPLSTDSHHLLPPFMKSRGMYLLSLSSLQPIA